MFNEIFLFFLVWFYFCHGLFILSILIASVLLCCYSNGFICTTVAALLMGFFWQQMAFVGHDIGHHSVTQGTNADNILGTILGNLFTGISVAWWRDNHNYHHIVTNSFNYDPDIQHMPIFAVSERFFKSFYSEYYKKEFKMDNVAQALIPYQHFLFYPVMALARFNLYAQSAIFLLTSKRIERRAAELFLLVVFWGWFLMLCSMLPSWSQAILFFMLSHATAGMFRHISLSYVLTD